MTRAVQRGAALAMLMVLLRPVDGWPRSQATIDAAYLVIDVASGRVIESAWRDPDQPVAVGSLIKPFTALAYAGSHGLVYPIVTCRGTVDGCWLPAGHGTIGLSAAVAGSCNAYFRALSQRTSADAMVATLGGFGMSAHAAVITPAAMVGLGDGLKLAPSALARGYIELAVRAVQPGVAPVIQGMKASARTGTGRAVGAAIGEAGALVKTGTAPCSHSPRGSADGYTVVIYPADRPRLLLLVQLHGRTGAETADVAGRLLVHTLGVR
jgi:cell division protein FtsI/penicillin-binding protein 2